MANAAAGVAFLDARRSAVIDGASVDWEKYLQPDDKSRIVPAESLAERARREILLGAEAEPGLTFPWGKTHGKVLLRPGKLSVWAGWSRHGKTQMLKQVMLNGIKHDEKVLFASMEEDVIDVWKDMAWIACAGPDPTLKTLDRFVSFITGKLWMYDQQGTVPPRRLLALVRYAAAELKVTHVVIDSLMMLALDRDDYEAQARFVGELKTVAKDCGVHAHLVAHMRKRDGKGGEETPGSLHDIAGGHEIGSKADSVFVVWRDRERKDTSKPEVILRVDKQRGRVNWTGNVVLNTHPGSRQFLDGNSPMTFWDSHVDF